MRNGGPTAYRADLAHHATTLRTRRRTTKTPKQPQPQQLPHGRDADAIREYEETFTVLLMQSGLPRMAGRALTCLYISDDGSVTAAELVRHLQVSPASVSKAVSLLEGLGLISRERDERRRERYFADNEVWYQSVLAGAKANAQLAETARQGVEILGRDSPAAARLENIARFVDFVAESITRAAEQARAILFEKA